MPTKPGRQIYGKHGISATQYELYDMKTQQI